jgi:hypothetical protein
MEQTTCAQQVKPRLRTSLKQPGIKRDSSGKFFWLNALHLVEKERIHFFHGGILINEICSVFLRFSPLPVRRYA